MHAAGLHILPTPEAAADWLRTRLGAPGAASLHADHRRLQPGDAFIAWPGASHDARRHVPQALAAGAAACLVEAVGAEALALSADERVAALAGLPNFGTFRPWLSDSKTSAADRLFHSPGRYVLVNGLVVAADWQALTSGTLELPINVTEKSETASGSAVWTGTLPSGQPAFGSSFCDDWTNHSKLQKAGRGSKKQTDTWWTFFEQGDCGSEMALYCIEQPTP